MKKDLLLDFTVDKAAKMVFITREFDADLSLPGRIYDGLTTIGRSTINLEE